MKRFYAIIIALFCIGCLTTFAHDVNKYKCFCLDVEDNPYGIETRFRKEFEKMGFLVIDSYSYEKLDSADKSRTLFAKYSYYINYSGDSWLEITLKNASGAKIWSDTGYGCTFLSPTGDIKKCTKQIMSSFRRLKYKFDESTVIDKEFAHPYSKWTEDSVKIYLSNNRISPVEGIYKNYSNDGNAYNIAILKYQSNYFGIVVDSDSELWKPGDTKFRLSYIDGTAYDAEYYNLNHQKTNAIASLKDNRILEFSAPINGKITKFSFLKVFPTGREEAYTNSNTNSHCKGTGSGVLISDNVIITNYHVIERAEKLEAIINIEGVPETYNARVLCSDKTNDLAIVCIKDEKFKNQGNSPFKIVTNSVDVGTSVFAMGFPLTSFLGDEVKITDGIISSRSGYDGDIVTYQISVPIQPGNSGGPLFDKNGNLVGITSAKIIHNVAENVGYAIKTPYVMNIIDSAPINISIPQGETLPKDNFPELIKRLKPFVVYLKVY